MITFPLPFDRIVEFTKEEKPLLSVDYRNSKYKGEAFFNYASNLGIPTCIDTNDLSYEEKELILLEYLRHKCVGIFPALNAEVADCLLAIMGSPRRLSDHSFLTEDERTQFARGHISILGIWVAFLTSMVVFALDCHVRSNRNEKASPETGDTTPTDVEKSFYVIDDPNIIGANVVNLFSIPAFMEWFLEKALETPTLFYFKHQFNTRCFGGKSLYEYVSDPKNAFFRAMLASIVLSSNINQTLSKAS